MNLSRRNVRGLSIIELMVGVVIGLFIVAGGSKMLADNLVGNRRVIIESRISQDLRAATDIIARDIRRAGHWQNARLGVTSASPTTNEYRTVSPTPAMGATNAITFRYSRDVTEDNTMTALTEEFSYDLNNGVLRSKVGAAMQALTDASSVIVTNFDVTPVVGEVSLGQSCRNSSAAGPPCCQPHPTVGSQCRAESVVIRPGATVGTVTVAPMTQIAPNGATITANCPVLAIRSFEIRIRGNAPAPNADVVHEIVETVRVRNDELRNLSCPV